jgi:putative endonuclease
MTDAYVYIVRCADNTLYTGCTVDIDRRIAAHNRGNGAKYTRSRRPVELVYWESLPSLAEAKRREAAIKKLSRNEKLEIVQKLG